MNVLNTYNEFNTSNFDLNIVHYGAEICESNYSFGPSVRENFVLHFVIDGKGRFTLNDKTVELQTGDLFLLPQHQVTFYQADSRHPWSYIWVGFSGSKAETILAKTSLLENCYCHSNLQSNILNQMFHITHFRDQKLNDATELQLTAELYKLLSFLVEEFPNENVQQDENSAKLYVKKTLKIIHTQYDNPLRIADIAKKLNLNRSYLYKIFKEQTGYSIKEYILQVKMEKSSDLLRNPRFTISEVANSVGFSDSLAFSKTFKKYYGDNPTCYRKSHLQHR